MRASTISTTQETQQIGSETSIDALFEKVIWLEIPEYRRCRHHQKTPQNYKTYDGAKTLEASHQKPLRPIRRMGQSARYFNQRFYDPELGRFLSQDPAKQGPNAYAYCANNPLMYVDPDGEFWWWFALAGALINGSQHNWSLESMINGAMVGAAVGLGVQWASSGCLGGMEISAAAELPDWGIRVAVGLGTIEGVRKSQEGGNRGATAPNGLSSGINMPIDSEGNWRREFDKWGEAHDVDPSNIYHPFRGTSIMSGIYGVITGHDQIEGPFDNMILYSGSAFRFAMNGSKGPINNLHITGGGWFYNGSMRGANNISVHWSVLDPLSWTVSKMHNDRIALQFGFGRVNGINYIPHSPLVSHSDWPKERIY